MSSSVHGSLGSSDFVLQSPLWPSGCTHSKQKKLGDPTERERRARPLSFFSLLCCSLFLFSWNDEWLFSLQSKRKLDPKKGRSQSSGEDVVWFSSIRAFFYCFHPLLRCCIFVMPCYLYFLLFVLLLLLLLLFLFFVFCFLFLFFFFFQVEVPPLTAGTTLEEEIIVAASQGVEEEAFNSGIIGEAELSM